MALKPHLWAYDDAPVKNPTAVLVLLALADEAADDGTGACPYIDKLAARARVSTRSVQNYLRDLYQQNIIDIGDQGIAQQRYRKGAGRAPRCWNLNLAATWETVPEPRSDAEMAAYSPAIGKKPSRKDPSGVQDLHPSAGDLDKQAHQGTGVQDLHPTDDVATGSQLHLRGAASCTSGVQPVAPFLSGPLNPDSVPPSSVRLGSEISADSALDGQMTIDGKTETPAGDKPPTLNDVAMGLARDWVAAHIRDECPIVMTGKNADPLMALRKLILPYLENGYTEFEIKFGLCWADTDIPTADVLKRGLTAVRRGWRTPKGWKCGDGRAAGQPVGRQRQGTGAMAGTNLHVDDLSAEQRRAENPFAGASRQSDYATDDATPRGAVA